MAENQIQKVRPKHEAIMNYILANPTANYGEVAGKFSVTPAWLSVVVNSHAFKDMLAKKQEVLFDSTVVAPLEDKISAAANLTLDAYMEKLPTMNGDSLAASADKLLGKLGFGTKVNQNIAGPTVNVFNSNHVSREVIDEARKKLGKAGNTIDISKDSEQTAVRSDNS